ncbi:MAG: hypothetical protein Q9159_000221 [Coniocarpon cinnabarinum]
MNAYEVARQRKIANNDALARDLGIKLAKSSSSSINAPKPPSTKRRKLDLNTQPTRASARIAAGPAQPSYVDDEQPDRLQKAAKKHASPAKRALLDKQESGDEEVKPAATPVKDIEDIRAGWSEWESAAGPPARDELTGMFHFESHPVFTPNKSPAEMLREGAFGGSYFRSLYSSKLRTTIEHDWRELPQEWIAGLNVETFLTNPAYDPEVNKYKVSCGQSIEQWEQNGWIDHQHDVRGWFQWYCRFYMGRRCEDDERQVSRWAKCAGPRGRWRRALLKKYKQLGIHDVMDHGEEDEDAPDVSPVVHQTCHHWAFEVRQSILDDFWREQG